MSATGVTGMQTSLKYAGPEPRTQSKAVSATLRHRQPQPVEVITNTTHGITVGRVTKDRSDVVKLAGTVVVVVIIHDNARYWKLSERSFVDTTFIVNL